MIRQKKLVAIDIKLMELHSVQNRLNLYIVHYTQPKIKRLNLHISMLHSTLNRMKQEHSLEHKSSLKNCNFSNISYIIFDFCFFD